MKNTVSKIVVPLIPVGIIGSSVWFAPDFMWQLGYNMKTPMTVFTMVVGLLGAIVINDSRKLYNSSKAYGPDQALAEWRIWTAINVVTITGLLWLLVQAIPSPTFKREEVVKYVPKVRVVEKPVVKYAKERIVYHTPSYEDAYNLCISRLHASYSSNVTLCHKQATEASLPPYRTVTKTVYVKDPGLYDKRFDQCMDKWELKKVTMQQVMDMTNTCKDYAKGN